MLEFAKTLMGKKFFDSEFPKMVKALEKIAASLDQRTEVGDLVLDIYCPDRENENIAVKVKDISLIYSVPAPKGSFNEGEIMGAIVLGDGGKIITGYLYHVLVERYNNLITGKE